MTNPPETPGTPRHVAVCKAATISCDIDFSFQGPPNPETTVGAGWSKRRRAHSGRAKRKGNRNRSAAARRTRENVPLDQNLPAALHPHRSPHPSVVKPIHGQTIYVTRGTPSRRKRSAFRVATIRRPLVVERCVVVDTGRDGLWRKRKLGRQDQVEDVSKHSGIRMRDCRENYAQQVHLTGSCRRFHRIHPFVSGNPATGG